MSDREKKAKKEREEAEDKARKKANDDAVFIWSVVNSGS